MKKKVKFEEANNYNTINILRNKMKENDNVC